MQTFPTAAQAPRECQHRRYATLPNGVSSVNDFKALLCQTSLYARLEGKGVFAAVSNRMERENAGNKKTAPRLKPGGVG